MAVARSLRRNTTITYFLAALLLLTFLYFFLVDSTSLPSLPQSRQLLKSKDAASNPLSPPSLPFKKQDPNEVPPPPPVVHYHMNNVTTSSQPIENRESVLILTPLAKFYSQYWDNLLALSYPHDLISLGFIIPKGREGNEATRQLQDRITKTQAPSNKKHRFASITILRQDDEPPTAQSESERH
ncbi:Golgi mannosyltransferase complex subunit, partial [Oleoguttula sp. CCFEE 5521]